MVDVDTSSYADPGGNKLLAAASNDPTAALQQAGAAQGLAMNGQVMQLRNVQLSQQQLDLAKSKLGALNQVFGAVVADPSPENFNTQLTEAVKQGVIDADTAQRAASQVMTFGGDPSKIKAWATDHLNQNANHQQLMDQAYGTPGMLSNGAVSSPTVTKTGAGAGVYPAAGPNVVQQMGPGEASTPVTGPVNPDGSPTVIPKGQFAQRQGTGAAVVTPFGAIAYPGRAAAASGPAAAPAGQGGGQPPAAPPVGGTPPAPQPQPAGTDPVAAARARLAAVENLDPSTMSPAQLQQVQQQIDADEATVAQAGRGSAQPAAAAPAAPGRQPPAAPAAPAAPAQPEPMTTGLAPGVAEGKSALAASNARAVTDLQTAADTVPQQNAAIDNLSAQLGKISTGPIAGKINTAKATYNQIAGMAGLPQIDPQGVAAMEEFHKSSAQLAGAAMSALGGAGTNDKLSLALAQNPNETLSNMGNAQVIPLLKGLNAAVTVKNEAQQAYLQAHGGDPSTIGAFQTDWNRNFSPRAFQFAYMSPDQRTELLASMSPAEKKQLAGALDTAESRGWIKAGASQ